MNTAYASRFSLVVAAIVGSICIAHANAEEGLKAEMETYLKIHSSQQRDSHWRAAFQQQAHDAMLDNQSTSDEERYADDKLFEFFFDKKKQFEDSSANQLSNEDKIEIAHWYLLFSNNGWRFPSRIAEYLTKKNYDRYMASR